MPNHDGDCRVTLDLGADALEEVLGVLHYPADEVEAGGGEDRDIRFAGYSANYTARLRRNRADGGLAAPPGGLRHDSE